MPRRPTPLRPDDGPRARFALALRALRDQRGAAAPSIDQISVQQRVPRSTLYAALRGDRIPTRDVLAIIVNAWDGDEAEWMARRSQTEGELERARRAALASAPAPAPANMINHFYGEVHAPSATFGTSQDIRDNRDHRDLVELLQEARATAGQPNLRALSRRAGLGASTLSEMFTGKRLPTADTLDAVLDALGVRGEERRRALILRDRASDRERHAREQRRSRTRAS